MNTQATPPTAALHDDCCAHDHARPAGPPAADAAATPIGKAWRHFRVPTMDCANEESEIRRAVDGIAGLRALTFQLGQRSLAMDATPEAAALAVNAIREAGFDPQPLPAADAGAALAVTPSSDPAEGSA